VTRTDGVIAVVAQDPSRRRGLRRLLRQAQYQVTAVADTATALRRAPDRRYDAAVVALTDRDGLAALVRIRGHSAAVIALAPAAIIDVVAALDAGADDFVAEPADAEELLARLRALLRRDRDPPPPAPLVTPDFTIDFAERRLSRAGTPVHLTPIEWRIVELMARHPEELLSHDRMLRAIWGAGKVDRPVYLRVYVAALRRKLEPDPTVPHYLLTEPGFGYRFRPTGGEG
jgi:two-component system, OmpR family, KDP operon response regulator KdpE